MDADAIVSVSSKQTPQQQAFRHCNRRVIKTTEAHKDTKSTQIAVAIQCNGIVTKCSERTRYHDIKYNGISYACLQVTTLSFLSLFLHNSRRRYELKAVEVITKEDKNQGSCYVDRRK